MSELRLIVMRHGESESVIGEQDRQRQLTDYGRRQASDIGERLEREGWIPDEILVSTATRTRETCALAVAALSVEPPIRFVDSFYLGEWGSVLTEVAKCSRPTVMIVGHNPGWSDLVELLSGKRVALMPSETALLTITETAWSRALRREGEWRCEKLLLGQA